MVPAVHRFDVLVRSQEAGYVPVRTPMTPLISIAVPTHNRARYAVHAIRSILALRCPELELVVSDTSDSAELLERLQGQGSLDDARLRYERPAQALDMNGNHNAVLERCRGQYVCLIGDDDTVTAELPLAARWAAERGVQVLVPNIVASYFWPDFRSSKLGLAHAGRLYFGKDLNAAASRSDSRVALQQALRGAAQGTDGLPKLYHGLVRRDLLEELKRRSGQYVHGSSPDMSAAVALSLVCPEFVSINYPLTVPGGSGGSNTGRSAMNQHRGRMGEDSQTKAFVNQGWSLGVPRYFAVETVWAHAALDTLRVLAPTLLGEFNFARLIAACRLNHPQSVAENLRAEQEAARVLGISDASWSPQLHREERSLRREARIRLMRRLLRPTASGGRPFVPDIDNVAEVAGPVGMHLRKLGLDWAHAESCLSTVLN